MRCLKNSPALSRETGPGIITRENRPANTANATQFDVARAG